MDPHVFVGFDGSESSVAAVEWAAGEARLRRARLQIVTCFDIPVDDGLDGSDPCQLFAASYGAARRRALGMQEVIAQEDPGLDVTARITAGSVAMELTAEAATSDLIVIGAGGRQRGDTVLLGRTGCELARHQTCPLVVVRDTGDRPATRLVVGVGRLPGAERALCWAGAEADRRGVGLRLVHVWDHHGSSRDVANAVLDGAVELVRARHAVAVQTELVERPAHRPLVGVVAPDELLVVGSQPRGRRGAALFGATGRNLIEHSPTTVVIVPRRSSDRPDR